MWGQHVDEEPANRGKRTVQQVRAGLTDQSELPNATGKRIQGAGGVLLTRLFDEAVESPLYVRQAVDIVVGHAGVIRIG